MLEGEGGRAADLKGSMIYAFTQGEFSPPSILRWLDPLEMPKFAYAGTEYHDTSKMLSNDTICDFLFKWEPFEGRD